MSDAGGALVRDSAFLSLTTPLGPNVLTPISFVGQETLTRPFHFRIDAIATDGGIDPNSLLNLSITLKLTRAEHPPRYFNGIVSRFAPEGGFGRSYERYSIELVPTLWAMGLTEDCRVFEQKTSLDIITQLLGDAGLTAYETRITGAKPVRPYVIQYNESDLAFVTRLMEEEGWFYFFEHSDGKHQLVIADNNKAFKPIDAKDMYVGAAGDSSPDALTAWRRPTRLTHGVYKLKDYDHSKSQTALANTQPTVLKAGGAPKRDLYRWPARTYTTSEVPTRTKLRLEASEAAAMLAGGAGTNESFYAGGTFSLTADAGGGDYALQSVTHTGRDESWQAGGGVASYSNSFTAFDASRNWREVPSVPRPRMAGIYSAVVIGPSGEEIYTDSLGRVKARLMFDHTPDATDGGSIWVRVIHAWAGGTSSSNWGFHFLPRVGTEVAVAFMDADPDRPVIVGGLFNDVGTPLFAMPGDKNKSGLRTRSTLKGGSDNYSEFSFDDTKGSELVFLHCEKDHTIEVEHDESLTVDNCRIHHVKVDETINIDNNQKIKIGNDQTIEVVNSRTTTIDNADETLTVKTGNMTTKVSTGNRELTVSTGNQTNTVSTGNYDLKVDTGNIGTKAGMGNISTAADMGNISTKASMGNISQEASLGNISIKADLGGVTIEALQSIELKVMGNSLKIDPVGVTINGIMVKVSGQAMTQVTAGGMLQMQGGIVMVN